MATTVAIVGLGLVGGSLARDLAARGHRVLAWDADPDSLAGARRAGVVHGVLGAGLVGLAAADILVLATPVDAAPAVLEGARPHLTGIRLVTDVGSTKRSIAAAADRLGVSDRFVGSHPLAGDHRSGWVASRAGLFEGARVYLCPLPATSADARRLAGELWGEVGGVVEEIDAESHDRLVAWTSHLPQAAATAFGLALSAAGVPAEALGPGARGLSRLSASSPEMWTGITLSNAGPLVHALAAFRDALAAIAAAADAGDEAGLLALFTAARDWAGGD